jgi:predicted N-acyltransferase
MTESAEIIRVVTAAEAVSPAEWDACAGSNNPFARHAFFSALEDSGSASASTGWQPAHIVVESSSGEVAGIAPGYIKSHSQGEYVFDHGWADAFARAGGRYYPKYQMSVPFTPATGPRLLLKHAGSAERLIRAAQLLCDKHDLSSAHATFLEADQVDHFTAAGWLIRHSEQFHWHNAGFNRFDDFLAALTARKRKTIRRERREAQQSGLRIVRLTGRDIGEAHWNAFWNFYQDTGARKWGRPYLTREFFSLIGERMAEHILLVLAYDGKDPVAGALNFIGGDCLFGRYWGATRDLPFLHFELCYYQAIEFAIEHRLKRVEAGAQGPHKLARGYIPVAMTSAHYIRHPALRYAVEDFLRRERDEVGHELAMLSEFAPYKKRSG